MHRVQQAMHTWGWMIFAIPYVLGTIGSSASNTGVSAISLGNSGTVMRELKQLYQPLTDRNEADMVRELGDDDSVDEPTTAIEEAAVPFNTRDNALQQSRVSQCAELEEAETPSGTRYKHPVNVHQAITVEGIIRRQACERADDMYVMKQHTRLERRLLQKTAIGRAAYQAESEEHFAAKTSDIKEAEERLAASDAFEKVKSSQLIRHESQSVNTSNTYYETLFNASNSLQGVMEHQLGLKANAYHAAAVAWFGARQLARDAEYKQFEDADDELHTEINAAVTMRADEIETTEDKYATRIQKQQDLVNDIGTELSTMEGTVTNLRNNMERMQALLPNKMVNRLVKMRNAAMQRQNLAQNSLSRILESRRSRLRESAVEDTTVDLNKDPATRAVLRADQSRIMSDREVEEKSKEKLFLDNQASFAITYANQIKADSLAQDNINAENELIVGQLRQLNTDATENVTEVADDLSATEDQYYTQYQNYLGMVDQKDTAEDHLRELLIQCASDEQEEKDRIETRYSQAEQRAHEKAHFMKSSAALSKHHAYQVADEALHEAQNQAILATGTAIDQATNLHDMKVADAQAERVRVMEASSDSVTAALESAALIRNATYERARKEMLDAKSAASTKKIFEYRYLMPNITTEMNRSMGYLYKQIP